MVINFNDSFAIFVGALAAWLVRNRVRQTRRGPLPGEGSVESGERAPRDTERWVVPLASGAIAGEGVMAIVVIAMRDLLHWLPK